MRVEHFAEFGSEIIPSAFLDLGFLSLRLFVVCFCLFVVRFEVMAKSYCSKSYHSFPSFHIRSLFNDFALLEPSCCSAFRVSDQRVVSTKLFNTQINAEFA